MFAFKAYFWNNDVYINEKYKYAAGEILTAYLNTDYFDMIEDEDWATQLKNYKKKLILSEDMDYQDYQNYNSNVYEATDILDGINDLLAELPPYEKILALPIKRLEDILNDYSLFFEDGLDELDDDDITWDTINKYGVGENDEYGNGIIHLHKFEPVDPDEIKTYDKDLLDILLNLNSEITEFFDQYISFIESYLAVHRIFGPFVDEFLHRKETFLTDGKLAKAMVRSGTHQASNTDRQSRSGWCCF